MTWTPRAALAALITSAVAHATTVDDFRRGTALTLNASAAQLHIATAVGDQSAANTTTGEVCVTKATGTLDVDLDLGPFGLPIVAHFIGTAPSANTVRLGVNQSINQCLQLGGTQAFVKSISGVLTLHLSGLAEPVATACAPDLSQRFSVLGGGESDTENQLVVNAESNCDHSFFTTFDVQVIAHDLKVSGLSGRAPPPPPLAIASFDSEQTFICPAPSKNLTVPGTLQLNQKAPAAGWSFWVWSSEALIPALPNPLFLGEAHSRAAFSTVVPKGWLGSYVLSTSGQGVFGKHEVTVSNDPNCRVVSLLPPKLPPCLPCVYGERVRFGKPSGLVSQSPGGAVFSTAPSLAGVAGYATADGATTGHLLDSSGTLSTYPDVQFIDLNDSGLAVGAKLDGRGGSQPVSLLGGTLRSLETPFGVGEARWVDASGTIAGWVGGANGLRLPAVWSEERLQVLPVPEGAEGTVVSLDDDGLAAVVFRQRSGTVGSYTLDLRSGEQRDIPPPPARLLDDVIGVELVGATTLGIAGHYLRRTGERVPFLDFGMGPQLIASLVDARMTVERLIGLGSMGQLIVHGTLDGEAQDMVLQAQTGVLR